MPYDPALGAFPWHAFLAVLSFVWGACIGSFLNVCIYRIPRDLSVVRPRSFCPACGRQIPWYLNVPLFSFLALRARCRFCRARISPRYFLVELLTAVLFLAVWIKFAHPAAAGAVGMAPLADWKLVPAYWLVVGGLILGTFVDFEHLIIPDRVTLGGIAAGLLLSLAAPSLHGQTSCWRGLLWSAIGASSGLLLLWLVAVAGRATFRREAMGMGDVKLIGAIGAFFGFRAVFFAILVGSLTGSIVGILLVVTGLKRMRSRIPFGPYLALAAVIWMLWGPTLWNAYWNLMLPSPYGLPPADLSACETIAP